MTWVRLAQVAPDGTLLLVYGPQMNVRSAAPSTPGARIVYVQITEIMPEYADSNTQETKP